MCNFFNKKYSFITAMFKSTARIPKYMLPFVLLLATLGECIAAEIVKLVAGTEDFIIDHNHLEWFEDTTSKLSFDEITHLTFTSTRNAALRNSNRKSTYWLRFEILNTTTHDNKWVLESLTPNVEVLQAWIPNARGKVLPHHAGLRFIKDKTYAHKNYIFDLPATLPVYKVYVKVYSRNETGLEFKIRTQSFFTRYALYEYYFLGIFYGILIIMLVYNMLLYVTNQDTVYLYYSLYVSSTILLSLSEDGLGVSLLWKDYPQLNLYCYYHVGPALFLLSSVLYARSFLNLKLSLPKFDKIVLISTAVIVLLICYYAIQEKFSLVPLYILPFVSVYLASIYIFQKGYRPARFFILGYSVVFLCLIVVQLRAFNLLPPTVFTVYILNYGILLEAVILSLALGLRLKLIRWEKEEAKQQLFEQIKTSNALQLQLYQELQEKHMISEKVNKELEQKVGERTAILKERTEQLSKANEKLELWSKQLADMNIQLDLDNWKLKKEVKEVQKARIVSEGISPEDFFGIFPDPKSCLRYLAELKWSNGFKCRKCGNEKYSEKDLARKCTRCDHIESPTSNTLFHGVKIPLNKAFFIVYQSNLKKKGLTLDELSLLLNVAKNTCWEFRKKVKQRQEEKKKILKLPEIESWEILIPD